MELPDKVTVCDQRVQEIVDLIKNNADIVAVETKINEFANSQQEYKNAYLARVLIHDDLVRDKDAYVNVYKVKLSNYIDRSHRVNEVFVNAAVKYLELVEICYKRVDKDQNYADILEYAFYIGDQLATAKHYEKESHQEKLLNLQNKLIELFVDNDEIEEAIKRTWENAKKGDYLLKRRFVNSIKNMDVLQVSVFKRIINYFEKNELKLDILEKIFFSDAREGTVGFREFVNKEGFCNELIYVFLERLYVLLGKKNELLFYKENQDPEVYIRGRNVDLIFSEFISLDDEIIMKYKKILKN